MQFYLTNKKPNTAFYSRNNNQLLSARVAILTGDIYKSIDELIEFFDVIRRKRIIKPFQLCFERNF